MGESNQNEIIKIVAGLVITFLIISIAFVIYRAGKASSDRALEGLDEMTTTLNETKYTDYNGQTITGNQVQALLNSWSNDEVAVEVKTKSGSDVWYNYTDDSLSSKSTADVTEASKKTSTNYVNPSGKFLCTVNRNANNVITSIVFEQQ